MSNRIKSNSLAGAGGRTDSIAPLLDEDEQNTITKELKDQANMQATNTRSRFFYLFLGLAGILLVCAVVTIVSPFEMEHQKHFQGIISAEAFFIFYVASGYCLGVAAFIVKVSVSIQFFNRYIK